MEAATNAPLDGGYDAQQSTALLIPAILQAIASELEAAHPAPQVAQLVQQITARSEAIAAAQAELVVDAQSAGHLELMALLLAAYQVLAQVMPANEARDLLRRAFITPFQSDIRAGTEALLDSSADPFQALTALSKEREAHFYGATFSFERLQDDQHAYLLNVRRCFYHTFLVANGAPELTPMMCAWDTETWGSAVQPARHKVRFERPTTLGLGGDCCRFWFVRTQPREGGQA